MDMRDVEVPRRPPSGMIQEETAKEARPNLVDRLYRRKREVMSELHRLDRTIELLEKNAALVEVVEVVLLAQGKAEPRPW